MSALGKFKIELPGTTFSSTFIIDEIEHSFQGSFNGVSVPPCTGVVTLTFARPEDLTSTRDFNSVFDKVAVTLSVDNGVQIIGVIDVPIPTPIKATGTGRWG
ncbi:hypothetical protein BGX24_001487, partial [Mortierella sp. AD032]